jgi:hypothetical protein
MKNGFTDHDAGHNAFEAFLTGGAYGNERRTFSPVRMQSHRRGRLGRDATRKRTGWNSKPSRESDFVDDSQRMSEFTEPLYDFVHYYLRIMQSSDSSVFGRHRAQGEGQSW